MIELVNYKGVYRTAPATPGLLTNRGLGVAPQVAQVRDEHENSNIRIFE